MNRRQFRQWIDEAVRTHRQYEGELLAGLRARPPGAVVLFEVRTFEPPMREMGPLLVECSNLVGRARPLLQSIGRNVAMARELRPDVAILDVRPPDGAIVAPGLIDVHTNGADEFLFNRDQGNAVDVASRAYARQGATGYLAGIMTAPWESMLHAAAEVSEAANQLVEAGDGDALVEVAVRYLHGRGVRKNIDRGVELLRTVDDAFQRAVVVDPGHLVSLEKSLALVAVGSEVVAKVLVLVVDFLIAFLHESCGSH